MNKKIRNSYILFAGLIIITIVLFVQKSQVNNSPDTSDFEPSFKESNLHGNKIEHLDSTSLVYSNFKYGFAMDFPNNWSVDRGVSEHNIIRAGQIDSAISFSINVIEISDMESDIDIWTLWDNKAMGLEANYRSMLPKLVNSNIYNFSPRKVYVSNREAIEIRFNYFVREVDVEHEMQCLFYSIYKIPFTYTIGMHIPKIFYEYNPDRYDYMINNFVLMKPNK
ncbi:MAG: hypothetical protein KAS71_09715 [Bacteroidales bacterium]|nr:hypothetical protein [Bacteroidales bacterium]